MSEAKRLEDIAKKVPIYSVRELESYRVVSDSRGRLIYAKSRQLVHEPSPGNPGLFVMDIFGNVYVHKDIGSVRHSSLAAGRKPAAAGMIMVDEGIVTMMSEITGHFHESQPRGNIRIVGKELQSQNVDMSKAKFVYDDKD